MGERDRELLTLLLATATRCRLYGREHPLTRGSLARLRGELDAAFAAEGRLRVTVVGPELTVNGRSLAVDLGPAHSLARRLAAKGVGFFELLPGVADDEILAFVEAISAREARPLTARPRLRLGEVTLAAPELAAEIERLRVREPAGPRADVSPEVDRLREVSRKVREFREVHRHDYHDLVYVFVSELARQRNVLLRLAEIRDHHLFSYVHAANVAHLVLGFAAALGHRAAQVYELGVAALLHDIGKSSVPAAILSKPGPLTAAEWRLVERHPAEGARLLLGQPQGTHLAVTVAFEHHLHFDRCGGYPVIARSRSPCLEAQLVSIADTFDALFAHRSYHREYDVLEALEILQDGRGTIYNPALVDAFGHFITMSAERRWAERR